MCGDVKDMLQMFSALAMLQKKKKDIAFIFICLAKYA